MTAATPLVISEEEYLSNPEYEHCEYVDGAVVPINMGTGKHSKSQTKLGRYLDEYLERFDGFVGSELRCLVRKGSNRRFRLPDVSVVLNQEAEDRHLDRVPDVVAEIRSPDDTLAFCYRKMSEYLEAGAKLGWLLLPDEKTVVVFLPGEVTQAVGCGEMLTGGDVLPGFEVLVDKLF